MKPKPTSFRLPYHAILFPVAVVILIADLATAQVPPADVSVLPVFVVPDGQKQPSKSDKRLLMKHLRWSQARYREMLGNRSTFDFEIEPLIFQSKRTIKQYAEEGNAANLVVGELLDSLEVSRFSCKHIFLCVFVNPEKNFPGGGGRPINGGYNTGGGIVVISTHAMNSKNFQSTLQHELGHSFGLPHVSAYRYDMKRNDSIMSYNASHHTNRLTASKTPGMLIPEDLRGLSFNDRVFKGLEFDEKRDVPRGYELQIVGHLPAMELPEHPLVKVETLDGETYKSSVANIVHSRILPSIDRGKPEFHKRTMWHSAPQEDGIVSVKLTFPIPTALDRIEVYSQHSGKSHGATGVKVSTIDKDGTLTEVANSEIDVPDGEIRFHETKSQQWEFGFRAGESKAVVLRGLRFFNGDQELYAPLVPYDEER